MTTPEKPSPLSPLQRAFDELDRATSLSIATLEKDGRRETPVHLRSAVDGLKAAVAAVLPPAVAVRAAWVTAIKADLGKRVENVPLETRMTTRGERPRHGFASLPNSRYCKECGEEEYHPVHTDERAPAEVVYEAPRAPLVPENPSTDAITAQDAIRAAGDEMHRALVALYAEVPQSVADEVSRLHHAVVDAFRRRMATPSHEVVSLRNFHDNVTAWAQRMRTGHFREVTHAAEVKRFVIEVLDGDTLMNPPPAPTVTKQPDGTLTVGPPPDVAKHLDELAKLAGRDWTADGGWANRSPLYLSLVRRVAEIIRGSAADIVAGRLEAVAGLVMSNLAHEAHLVPRTQHGQCGGYESNWPLEFRVRLPDGTTEDYEVEREVVPQFKARKK